MITIEQYMIIAMCLGGIGISLMLAYISLGLMLFQIDIKIFPKEWYKNGKKNIL